VGRKWGRSRSARRRRTTLSATRREFSQDSDVILVLRNHRVVGGIMCSRTYSIRPAHANRWFLRICCSDAVWMGLMDMMVLGPACAWLVRPPRGRPSPPVCLPLARKQAKQSPAGRVGPAAARTPGTYRRRATRAREQRCC
jgi:hypothetical protein